MTNPTTIDAVAVRTLLGGFANANARELRVDNRPFWRRWLDYLQGGYAPSVAGALTPLQAAFEVDANVHERGQLTDPTEIVRELLAHGANVNQKDEYDVPLIGVAVCNAPYFENNNSNCITLLLAHGANPNAETRNGLSMLYCAILSDDTTLTVLLLKRGAKCCMYGDPVPMINVAKYVGDSPVMFALLPKETGAKRHH